MTTAIQPKAASTTDVPQTADVDSAKKAEATNTDTIDTSDLETKLLEAGKADGVEGLIKVVSQVVTQLLQAVNKMLETLSGGVKKKDTPKAKDKSKDKTKGTKTKTPKETKAGVGVGDPAKTKTAEPAKTTAATQPVATTQPVTTTQATTTPPATTATQGTESTFNNFHELRVGTSKEGLKEVYTNDGYRFVFEAKDQAWLILDPEGKQTRIWGDPHFVESDGDTWDFKENSSLLFGNNKVTIETVPYGNGQTVTSRVTIYNGDSRVTIDGIDKNQPNFRALSLDAVTDDAIRDDGDIFVRAKEANGDERWILAKDRGEKFDAQFAAKVSATDAELASYLSEDQRELLK